MRMLALAALSFALFAACDDEEFARTAGQLPGTPDGIPTGALYAAGSFATDVQDFSIDDDTEIEVVYRLNFPAPEEITVTVSVGTQEDIDVYNDANGLEDKTGNHGYLHRYQMLPETNYILPETMTLTVPKGKTESAPMKIGLIFDEKLLNAPGYGAAGKFMGNPLMLPLRTQVVDGTVFPGAAGPSFGIGVRPANRFVEELWGSPIEIRALEERPEKFTGIVFCDCRTYNPFYANYYLYKRSEYEYMDLGGWGSASEIMGSESYYPFYDIECLRPALVSYDEETLLPVLTADPDLLFVLTHQGRYMDPQRNRRMKFCVSVEIAPRSPQGLCNLGDEARSSLVWQIAEFVRKYKLDGVSLNDYGATYTADNSPAVDKASYTKFLRDLRAALGEEKLILLSYRADENAALYTEHDGIRAGDFIDFAWWGIANTLCVPYSADAAIKPIAGLDKGSFCPMAIEVVDTPEYNAVRDNVDPITYQSLALIEAQKLYDEGQFGVIVDLGLTARTQGFAENNYGIMISIFFGKIPLHESDMSTKGGWASDGVQMSEANDTYWFDGNGYGNGLKDW